MKFISSKYLILLVSLLAACFFLLSYIFTFSNEKYLVVAHNDFSANVGPITIIDLKNDRNFIPAIKGYGCNGLSKFKYNLIAYCGGSENLNHLWGVSLKDFTVFQDISVPKPYDNISAPRHGQIIFNEKSDEYYLTSGGPLLVSEDGSASDAGIVVVDSNESFKVNISDLSKPYFILKTVLDSEEGKLWVMSMGDEEHVLLDRMDLALREVDATILVNSYSGYDMIINNEDLLISIYRNESGDDLVVIDKNQGVVRETISLSTLSDQGYNALSLLKYKENILVSSYGGIFMLNYYDYKMSDFITNNDSSQFTFFLETEKGIYTIDNYSKVFFIPEEDLYTKRLILDATGQGLTSLFFVQK